MRDMMEVYEILQVSKCLLFNEGRSSCDTLSAIGCSESEAWRTRTKVEISEKWSGM